MAAPGRPGLALRGQDEPWRITFKQRLTFPYGTFPLTKHQMYNANIAVSEKTSQTGKLGLSAIPHSKRLQYVRLGVVTPNNDRFPKLDGN